MIAELPREVSQPEHVVEEIVYRGPSWRVAAGYGAESRFCCPQRRGFPSMRHPRSAMRPPIEACPQAGGGGPPLAPPGGSGARGAASGRTPRACAPGSPRAVAEEAQVREDCNAGELLLSDAEPALHRCVAVPGPQRPVVGCRRSEVPGVDVGRGSGRPQGCVPSVRQRMVHLCPLRNRAERSHCGGP